MLGAMSVDCDSGYVYPYSTQTQWSRWTMSRQQFIGCEAGGSCPLRWKQGLASCSTPIKHWFITDRLLFPMFFSVAVGKRWSVLSRAQYWQALMRDPRCSSCTPPHSTQLTFFKGKAESNTIWHWGHLQSYQNEIQYNIKLTFIN